MEIANLSTGAVLLEHEFRDAHGWVVIPPDLPADLLAELGYAVVEYEAQPSLQPGEQLEPGELEISGGRAVRGWVVTPAPATFWPAAIAAKRYEVEIGGIEVSGMRVDTDDRSKSLILGAAVETLVDPAYVMQWKTSGVFIELAAPQIMAVARAVRAHVQACFDREAALLAALADQSFVPAMLEEGWPVAG